MNQIEAFASLSDTNGFFRHWMGHAQRRVLCLALQGEEGVHFAELLTTLKAHIEAMPKTYETEDIPTEDKVLHLHYFRGGVDAWIVEKDMGDGSDDLRQHQAYGKQGLFGGGWDDAEWGYISIQELIDNDVELDLHWTPTMAKDMK